MSDFFQRESEHARDLKAMLIALGFPKPPANITPQQLFAKVEQKVSHSISVDFYLSFKRYKSYTPCLYT